MSKEFSRAQRVSELIRRELAGLFADEINDPRIRSVTITKVDLSRDLRNAKVYVSQLDDDADHRAAALHSLNRASGFLRRQLGRRLDLKVIPLLDFHYDDSIERGVALSHLIDQAVGRDRGPRDKES